MLYFIALKQTSHQQSPLGPTKEWGGGGFTQWNHTQDVTFQETLELDMELVFPQRVKIVHDVYVVGNLLRTL